MTTKQSSSGMPAITENNSTNKEKTSLYTKDYFSLLEQNTDLSTNQINSLFVNKESKLKFEKEYSNKLRQIVQDKDNEINELRKKVKEIFILQKQIESLEVFLNTQVDESTQLKRIVDDTLTHFEIDYNHRKKEFEIEVNQLKSYLEMMNKKIEHTHQLEQQLIEKDKLLEETKKRFNEFSENMMHQTRKQKLDYTIELDEMKNYLSDQIEKSKKNFIKTSLSHLDIASKVSIIQNHKLITEIEYKSNYINYIQVKLEEHDRTIAQLKDEIEVHKKLEQQLIKKNKILVNEINEFKDSVKEMLKEINSNEIKTNDKTIGKGQLDSKNISAKPKNNQINNEYLNSVISNSKISDLSNNKFKINECLNPTKNSDIKYSNTDNTSNNTSKNNYSNRVRFSETVSKSIAGVFDKILDLKKRNTVGTYNNTYNSPSVTVLSNNNSLYDTNIDNNFNLKEHNNNPKSEYMILKSRRRQLKAISNSKRHTNIIANREDIIKLKKEASTSTFKKTLKNNQNNNINKDLINRSYLYTNTKDDSNNKITKSNRCIEDITDSKVKKDKDYIILKNTNLSHGNKSSKNDINNYNNSSCNNIGRINKEIFDNKDISKNKKDYEKLTNEYSNKNEFNNYNFGENVFKSDRIEVRLNPQSKNNLDTMLANITKSTKEIYKFNKEIENI